MNRNLGLKAVDALRIAEVADDGDEYVRRQTAATERHKEKPLIRKLEELTDRGYTARDPGRFKGYRLTAKGQQALLEHLGDPTERPVRIRVEVLLAIAQEAAANYPEECCGFLQAIDMGRTYQVLPKLNVQTDLHRINPKLFPKDGRTAYAIGPEDAQEFKALLDRGADLLIYHSHVNTPPVFSRDDARKAMVDGRPLFPGVDYLVLGIAGPDSEPHDAPVNYAAVYRYNTQARDYLPVKLEIVAPAAQEAASA